MPLLWLQHSSIDTGAFERVGGRPLCFECGWVQEKRAPRWLHPHSLLSGLIKSYLCNLWLGFALKDCAP
jgi:hypothetical protein